MKKNLYYRHVIRRQNLVRNAILDFFLLIASYPRMLLEVFIRKNFGERYFNIVSALTLAAILAYLPSLFDNIGSRRYSGDDSGSPYFLWYAYTIAFVLFSIYRAWENRRSPSVFDFGKQSWYSGEISPWLKKIKIFGQYPSVRDLEIFYEPGLFLIAGVIISLTGQALGLLLIFASICYSFSYISAYDSGDNFVMDKIDEMMHNMDLEDSFVSDAESDHGVRYYARKPKDETLRRKLAESFIEEEETAVAF